MARPRKVPAQDSLRKRDGEDPPLEPSSYIARRAKAALRRLSNEETIEAMRYTPAQLEILDAIASGLPVRNAREAVAALRLKAEFLLSKPTSAIDHRVGILVVENPYSEETQKVALSAAVPAVVAALPEGQAPAEDAPPFEDEEEP